MRTRQQKQVLLMRMLACASHLFRSYPIARVKRDPLQGGLVPVGATWLRLVVEGSHRQDWLEQGLAQDKRAFLGTHRGIAQCTWTKLVDLLCWGSAADSHRHPPSTLDQHCQF